jgi:hypothetical protein
LPRLGCQARWLRLEKQHLLPLEDAADCTRSLPCKSCSSGKRPCSWATKEINYAANLPYNLPGQYSVLSACGRPVLQRATLSAHACSSALAPSRPPAPTEGAAGPAGLTAGDLLVGEHAPTGLHAAAGLPADAGGPDDLSEPDAVAVRYRWLGQRRRQLPHTAHSSTQAASCQPANLDWQGTHHVWTAPARWQAGPCRPLVKAGTGVRLGVLSVRLHGTEQGAQVRSCLAATLGTAIFAL